MSRTLSAAVFLWFVILVTFICFGTCETTDSVEDKIRADCEAFTEAGGEPLLSINNWDTIFDINLVVDLEREKSLIGSVKVKNQCALLLCNEPKLKGLCSEHVATSEKLSEATLVKSAVCRCRNNETEDSSVGNRCAKVYSGWHFDGFSQNVEFPGSAGRVKIGNNQIWSAVVKPQCALTAWRNSETAGGNKVFSLELQEDVSFVPSLTLGEPYAWYCCHCDEHSQAACKKAIELSLNLETSEDVTKDTVSQATPDFVRYGKKVIGIGRNYRWKNSELAKVLKVPDEPIVFMKPSTSYIVEGQKITLPKSLGTIFYEIELGVVIGRQGKSIPKAEALDYISGYFLALDMTAKEFLKKSLNQSKPWEIGKGFDTACPVGHFIPKHLIPNPNDIQLECKINGNVTQSANTKEMIFNVESLIAYISKYMTLEPYDVILTGTPDGLGPIHDGDIIQGQLGNITTIQFEAVSVQD